MGPIITNKIKFCDELFIHTKYKITINNNKSAGLVFQAAPKGL